MPLVKCPECRRDRVSNFAASCPDCGFPIRAHFCTIKEEPRVKEEALDEIGHINQEEKIGQVDSKLQWEESAEDQRQIRSNG